MTVRQFKEKIADSIVSIVSIFLKFGFVNTNHGKDLMHKAGFICIISFLSEYFCWHTKADFSRESNAGWKASQRL